MYFTKKFNTFDNWNGQPTSLYLYSDFAIETGNTRPQTHSIIFFNRICSSVHVSLDYAT